MTVHLDEATDIKTELERIQVEYLHWDYLSNNYFLLKYGCGNKMCELVLRLRLNNVFSLHRSGHFC
jgi:hypothetical protein